ncbi:MAG: toll/interleukin-1 receptor domain-containing protein [Alphaproteobacteria bacterium]|nr:toll/interleukin-1 receptor domain-containing protein [Alphaproteobacteria bacterium]MBU0794052.1 toll/interleukin-1 receptor domain-containing protein [Alphaproteobacteria bacterium]MBU0877379.1 toll/interleukin-1 receptor domain-containing protein [Alphaproteobacteria bacterium]MBU1770246.1 toll/interleukin-1 receptor domain-containing protein [Alphaproteobacteria bacterium]
MIDFLRIHVVWDVRSREGARIAERLSQHFDGIGMERDGVAFRVPVRFSSTPWDEGSTLPRPIDLGLAKHNAVILLHDEEMHDRKEDWDGWVSDLHARMKLRAQQDVYVAFGSPTGEAPLRSDAEARVQYQYRKKWSHLPTESARDQRLLLLMLIRVRDHFRKLAGEARKEPFFVSHAKADGDLTARAIVDFINDTSDALPLDTFYDAAELMPGEIFEERFKEEIGHGTLLAIVSDVYETRPWCVFELTEAKRARRPIVLADVCGNRVSRTYPYGANLPRVRVVPRPGDTAWIEPLLVEALSEGLRCDLFERQATLASPADTLILPRPPELFDVIDRAALPGRIVYPDPPVGDIEADLLFRALAACAPATDLKTLGQIT